MLLLLSRRLTLSENIWQSHLYSRLARHTPRTLASSNRPCPAGRGVEALHFLPEEKYLQGSAAVV